MEVCQLILWGGEFGSDEESKVVEESVDDSNVHDKPDAINYPKFIIVNWFLQEYNKKWLLEAFVLEIAKVCSIEGEDYNREHDPVYNYEAVLHPG